MEPAGVVFCDVTLGLVAGVEVDRQPDRSRVAGLCRPWTWVPGRYPSTDRVLGGPAFRAKLFDVVSRRDRWLFRSDLSTSTRRRARVGTLSAQYDTSNFCPDIVNLRIICRHPRSTIFGASQFTREIARSTSLGHHRRLHRDKVLPERFRVTRGQMAAFLSRAIGGTGDGDRFLRRRRRHALRESNQQHRRDEGITGGCATRRYCPTRRSPASRWPVFLVRAFELPLTATDFFTDDNTSIHERSINRLRGIGHHRWVRRWTLLPEGQRDP